MKLWQKTLLLGALAILFLAIGLQLGKKRAESPSISPPAQDFLVKYYPITTKTYLALAKFSKVDEAWMQGKETDENYEKAWTDLNSELKKIKEEDEKLGESPIGAKRAVDIHRQGLQKVIDITDKVVDFLSGITEDPSFLVESRQEFIEGLEELRVASELVDDLLKESEKVQEGRGGTL